jgi:hypothetical protein
MVDETKLTTPVEEAVASTHGHHDSEPSTGA